MRKSIPIAIIAAAAAAACSVTACSAKHETELTEYDITAALSADHVLTATVACDYVNNTDVPLDEVWFHLYPNAYRENASVCPIAASELTAAFPNGRSYSTLEIARVCVNGAECEITLVGTDEDILSVPLGGTLEPYCHAAVEIEYSVKLPNVEHRLGYNDKTVNLCNFYPIACVYRDGAFVADPYYPTGDPFFSECADYRVTLSVPEGMTGAFTGKVCSQSTADGVTTYELQADSVRDFGAVLGSFERMSGLAGTTIVNYCYYSDSAPERALNTAIAAVNTFGDMFGAYPYGEYTVVQTPFVHGGMEYPCLSLISDRYTGDAYADIIVHETAHQWWYSAVGNDEVKYAWLDEALAEYSTMLFYEANTDGYAYTFNGKRGDALTAYMLYCETYKNKGLADTSMTRPVNEYADSTEYSYMVYVKGALMLDDVRDTVGSDAFFDGMRRYYADRKFKIAEPQDLVGALEKSSGRRLDALFNSWLDGNVKLYSSH